MRLLAWPAWQNSYTASLYRAITSMDDSIEVIEFDLTRSWRERADVAHLHWPEAALGSPSRPRAWAKSVMLLLTLCVLRLRGTKLVWTLHNLESHEGYHPRLESVLRRAVARLTDRVVHLSQESREIGERRPELAATTGPVIPLVDFLEESVAEVPRQSDARARLGLDPDLVTFASVGIIRPYKNVPELLEAFAAMSVPAQLVIAGQPDDDALRTRIERLARETEGVHLDLRWLDDEELAEVICASDAVIAVYRHVHNSSVVTSSLALGRPVAVNPVGSLREIAESHGPEWVHSAPEGLDGPALDALAVWARQPRSPLSPDRPTLADHARAQLDLYRELVDEGLRGRSS